MSPFPCGHSVNQQRLLRMLEVLPFAPSKRRLCADCRTRTPGDVCALLDKMTDQQAKVQSQVQVQVQGGGGTEFVGCGYWLQYALDRLAVHRRTILKEAGKPGWTARLVHWARVTYRLVGLDEIRDIGDATRRKWGPTVEAEALRALGQAALRAHRVAAPIEPAEDRITAGLNDLIRCAGQRANETQDPEQLEAIFTSAAVLSKLAREVGQASSQLQDLFQAFESRAGHSTKALLGSRSASRRISASRPRPLHEGDGQ